MDVNAFLFASCQRNYPFRLGNHCMWTPKTQLVPCSPKRRVSPDCGGVARRGMAWCGATPTTSTHKKKKRKEKRRCWRSRQCVLEWVCQRLLFTHWVWARAGGLLFSPALVQVHYLLHELICGEGHGLGGDAADVVERQTPVQSFLNPVLLVHVLQGLCKSSVGQETQMNNVGIVFMTEIFTTIPYHLLILKQQEILPCHMGDGPTLSFYFCLALTIQLFLLYKVMQGKGYVSCPALVLPFTLN